MFDRNLIVLTEEKFTDQSDVINYLSGLNNPYLADPGAYREDVLEREKEVSTFVGYNTAIPHAKSEAVKEPFVICAKLENAVPWNGEDAKQIFMLGVPKDANGENAMLHLKILCELSKNLMRENFRDALDQAQSSEEIYNLVKHIEEEIEQ